MAVNEPTDGNASDGQSEPCNLSTIRQGVRIHFDHSPTPALASSPATASFFPKKRHKPIVGELQSSDPSHLKNQRRSHHHGFISTARRYNHGSRIGDNMSSSSTALSDFSSSSSFPTMQQWAAAGFMQRAASCGGWQPRQCRFPPTMVAAASIDLHLGKRAAPPQIQFSATMRTERKQPPPTTDLDSPPC